MITHLVIPPTPAERRARDLCAEYGIDYDAAYRETHGSNAP